MLTIVGIAAAGPATKRAEPEVLGARQGGLGDERADRRSTTTAPAATTAPLVPVVTLPAGKTVARPASAPTSRALEQRVARGAARLARRRLRVDRRPRVRLQGRAHDVRRSPIRRRDPDAAVRRQPEGREARCATALRGATVAGAPVHLTGFDALADASRAAATGPASSLEALLGGLGALLVLAFVFASLLAIVPIADGDRRRS